MDHKVKSKGLDLDSGSVKFEEHVSRASTL